MGLHAPRTLLYFSVSGLDLLGKLDELDREQTIECPWLAIRSWVLNWQSSWILESEPPSPTSRTPRQSYRRSVSVIFLASESCDRFLELVLGLFFARR